MMRPDQRPAFPGASLQEIPWPTEVTPGIIDEILKEGNIVAGVAKRMLGEAEQLLTAQPFIDSFMNLGPFDTISSKPLEQRRVAFTILLYGTLPMRLLYLLEQDPQPKVDFSKTSRLADLFHEDRLHKLFSDSIAPTARSLFYIDMDPEMANLRRRMMEQPEIFFTPEERERQRKQIEDMINSMEGRLTAIMVDSFLQRERVKSLIETGDLLAGIDIVTLSIAQQAKETATGLDLPSYEEMLGRSQQRFHQLYQAARERGLG